MSGLKTLIKQKLPGSYTKLRELKFSFGSNLFKNYVATHSFGGLALTVHITDVIARGWYDKDWELLAEIELLKQFRLKPGATVFDIGAHQNIVAMMLANEVGHNGKVVAIEGSEHNHIIGVKNAAENSFGNIVSLHAAVANQEGEVLFSDELNGSVALKRTDFRAKMIPAVTIDSLARDYGEPDLVFLDVEGHELAALQGAKKTLDTQATWFIEVHGDEMLSKYGSKNADILDFFPECGDIFFRVDEQLPFERLSNRNQLPTCRFFMIVVPKL